VAAATIESAFVLVDRASGPIRKIRRELRGMERDAQAAGTAMDGLAGPKAARELEALARDTRGVGRAVKDVRTDTSIATKALGAYETRMRGARRETERMDAATNRLANRLRMLGAIDARPRVQLDVLARTRAEIAALNRELTALNRRTVSPGALGRGGGLGGGGIGRGVSGAYAGSGGFGVFTTRTGMLAGAAVAALPAVQALGGATGALGASLAGAGLGLGSMYAGGGGPLVAGVGALAAVAIPAKKNVEAATKAQQAYTKSVEEFGRRSKQAIAAKLQLDRVMASAAPGTRGFIAQRRALGRDWNRASRGAQTDLLGLGTGAMRRLRTRALPSLGADAGVIAGATRTQGLALADTLTGPAALGIVRTLAHDFAGDLDEAQHIAGNLSLTFGRLAVAAHPFFADGMDWVEQTTGGWRSQSKDIGHVRREMAGYVGDLRSWAHLTESAFELVKDVAGPGRRSGTSLVDDLTRQLHEWDDWAKANPVRIERFFDDSVDSTKQLAGALGEVGKDLHEIADVLTPVLNRFAQLADVAGGLGLLAPTAIRIGLGRLSGGGGGGGAGAAGTAGAAATAGLLMGGGASLAARGGQQRAFNALYGGVAGSRYAGPASQLGARSLGLSRLGGPAVGRFVGPIAAIQAMLGATQDPGGAGLLGRWRNLTSSMTLGLVDSQGTVNDRANRRNLGALQDFIDGMPGNANTYGGARRQVASLRALRGRVMASDAPADQRRTVTHYINAEIQARKDLLPSLLAERDARSRDRGAAQGQSASAAFRSDLRHLGPDAAFGHLRSTLLGAGGVGDRNFAGGRQLAEAGLQAAQDAAKNNPKLAKEYDKLSRDVSRRFDDMGHNVVAVNGRIYSATAKDWPRIREALARPAEQARQRVSDAFSDIQRRAIAALTDMGYSPSQARSLIRQSAGKGTGRVDAAVRNAKATGALNTSAASPAAQAFGPSPGNPAKIGDGVGADRPTAANTTGGVGLMGANPNLAGYAREGSQFGLHVSSGRRPGAITASGNASFHASGHAIDETGPAAGMLAFARYMAETHGSGLEELIHTPLGYGIKDGKKVPLSFWGPTINAMHRDHVHVADVDPGGAGGLAAAFSPDTFGPGMQSISLTGPKSGLGGVAGALADAASGAYAAGLEAKLNGALGAGGLTSAGGKYNKSSLAALWVQAGGAPGVAQLMASVALAESGGNPAAHNRSGASGLWQILGVPFAGNVWDPLTNARMAVAKYRSQGLGAWEAYSNGSYRRYTGDGTGWSRPRMAGGRARAGRGGGVSIANTIHVHAGGHDEQRVVAVIHREIGKFVDNVEDELRGGAEEQLH
jgi:hypothetical protein